MTNTFALLENFCVNCLAYQRRITPRVRAVVQSLIMSPLQYLWDFAGSPVVKTPCSHCRRCGLIPGWRTKIPHAAGHGQKNYSIFLNKFLFLINSSLHNIPLVPTLFVCSFSHMYSRHTISTILSTPLLFSPLPLNIFPMIY